MPKNPLRSLSLVKQLLVVFSAVAILVVAVLMPLVDYNLNSIIDNQMYEQLEQAQSSAVDYQFFPNDNKVKRTYHIVYNATSNSFTFSNLSSDSDSVTGLYSNVFGNYLVKIVNSSKHATIEDKGNYNGETYYYRILKLAYSSTYGQRYLITLMSSSYSNELINSLRNQIIYIQYGFLAMVAFVLILWVFSLIKPLHKIKVYIDSIKEHKDMTLNIDRKDEIGIVATALVDMNEERNKQEKVKEEMIHNISHDLKTPIALIKTYGQSVKDDIYPYGDKNSSMDIILENADRLEHKVKALLYLNRLDYIDGEEKALKPFDMKELVEHVVSQMDALNALTIEADLDQVQFIGNPEHWRVAVENIIENASRYAKSLIRITLKENSLIIYNDGDPIDEDKKEDLFNPYVKGVKGQFGLGLSIVSKTAEMYGYKVEARNEEVGVSFVFTKRKE